MVQNKPNLKFDVTNLTDEEKEIRREGIDFLFTQLKRHNSEILLSDAEDIYDRMQQAAIDHGKSDWEFYKKK